MARPITFLLILSLASAASASNWVPFATCGGDDLLRSYFYDRASLVAEGFERIVSIRGDYSRVRGSRASQARIQWAMNCQARTFVERSRTEYRPDQTVVENYGSPTAAMTIAPNSVPEKLLRHVC